MRRYWIESFPESSEQLLIEGDLFHHIFDVCRQSKGSKFELLTENGLAIFVEVIDVAKKKATVQKLESRVLPKLPDPPITLALNIPKFPVLEAILEKAVELGVTDIQLLYSDFSFLKTNDNAIKNKFERWQKIIKTATQQTGRGDLLKLREPVEFLKYASEINPNQGQVGLFAYEGEGLLSIREACQKMKSNSPIQRVFLFVGSEGGYSASEVQKMIDLGLHPVTLGSQVLRVETACLALVSVLKYELDLFQ